MGNGLANQVSNPDVEVDITKPDMVIRRQIAVLKEMTSWLKAAYTGTDISFVNEDAGSGEESGSGCDSPSCDGDNDIYFSTPVPVKPGIKLNAGTQPSPLAVHGWHPAVWHWQWQRSCSPYSPFTRDKTS
ncbi:glypican-1-like [Pimephales promelas]|uniref:glypican-1-like n=1 Tax=Pimephales promelas TaxID=90988 RepID=UPI001955B5EE|nr:glypican-1-like [Pimephales promelas]